MDDNGLPELTLVDIALTDVVREVGGPLEIILLTVVHRSGVYLPCTYICA